MTPRSSVPLLLCGLLACLASAAPAASPNVLLISVDTLRSDHLGSYGSRNKTPAFDEFAARSIVFEQAISQVPLTLPSHTTILTGLYPDQHGIRNNENFALPASALTVAEVFRRNGYTTGAVVGSFSLDSGFGLNQGFQDYDDDVGTGDDPSANRYAERKASVVWQRGKDWLEKQKQPWFCFLHFFDPHTAYHPPAPFPATYDGEIAYVDSVLHEIFVYLKTNNLFTNTIVLLLSDHGEALGEHGEASHGVFLYDATLHVPLMISAPGLQPGRVREQVRLVDVAPTLVQLAGIPPGDFRPAGQSLTDLMNGKGVERPAYSETFYTNLLMGWAPLQSVRAGGRKWIRAPRPELYDLARDPQEVHNLYTPSSIPVTMQREMAKRSGKPVHPPVVENADPEIREKLASLGYVTGGSTAVKDSGFDPKDGIEVWARIEEGVTSAQSGDLETATRLFQEAIQKQPGNVLARKFLANVLRSRGDLAGAINHLREAIKSELHRNETRYDLAQALYELGQNEESFTLLQEVVREDASQVRAWKLAGLAAVRMKHFQEAEVCFAQAVALRPADPDALSHQARMLSYLQKDRPAVEAYLKLEAIRPLTEEECLQVAALHLTMRDAVGAERYFRRALQAAPESRAAWKGLGLIHASQGQWRDALDAFVRAGDCSAAGDAIRRGGDLPAALLETYRKQCP